MDIKDNESLETTPLMVAFGNPLLDITAVVSNQNIHLKYGLPVDGQLEVNKTQRHIFNEVMENYEVESTAGGCALNSSRVFSWVLGERESVLFVGSIGKDQAAKKIRNIVNKSGVKTKFVEIDSHPTGMCVALVLDTCRCLCADVGAANICEPYHIFNIEMIPILETSKFIYVEGYFITHSFDTALQLAKFAQEHKKLFIFNLCGSYVCETHPTELAEIIPYVDILFGYLEEYKTFDKFVNIQALSMMYQKDDYNVTHSLLKILKAVQGEETIIKCDKNISDNEITSKYFSQYNGLTDGSLIGHENIPVNGDIFYSSNESNVIYETTLKSNDFKSKEEFYKQQKIVIVTTGPSPLLYIVGSGLVREHSVPAIPAKDIIDTTGAGDSFVGGFLAALSRKCTVEQCLDCGIWSAQQILKQKGCTLPQWKATFLQSECNLNTVEK